MDEACQLVANPPFETPPQTPHTSGTYQTPPQTPRWSDYDDDDDSWIPEEIKARDANRSAPERRSPESNEQPEHTTPEGQTVSSITVVEREVNNEEEAPTDQDLNFGSTSAVILQPQPTRPWLEHHGAQDGGALSEFAENALSSDFKTVHTDKGNRDKRNDDDDVEVRSTFSDTSSDKSDGEYSEDADNDNENSEQSPSAEPASEQESSTQPPTKQSPAFDSSEQERLAEAQPLRRIAQPADPRQFETGGNSPDLNYVEQKNGPFVPEPGSDYGQLKRLVDQGKDLSVHQNILWKRLARVQDKHLRYASGDTVDDEYRYAKMLQRREESETNPSVRTKPIAPSPLNPEWDTMEQQLERAKRKVHNLTAAVRNAKADQQFDMEKAKRDTGRMQKEIDQLGVQLELVREQLDEAVNENECKQFQHNLDVGQWQDAVKVWQKTVDDLHELYGAELTKAKDELRIKTTEVEQIKIIFPKRYQEMKDKALAKIADLEQKLKAKVDNVEAAKAIEKLEESLQRMKVLNVMLEDNKELLDAKSNELSEKVQELEKKETSWLEIFGLRRMDKTKRRRSEGEIYTRAQEIENLERRLHECSERLKAETKLKLHFKKGYEVLNQELSTEKNDTADLLSETHQLSGELQKSKIQLKEKEEGLQTLAEQVKQLMRAKSSLERDLQTTKLELISWREADSPTHYVGAFFDLAELDSAKMISLELRSENKALRSNFDKLKHLIPPQQVRMLEEQYNGELDELEYEKNDLRKEAHSLKAHHLDVVSAIKEELDAAHKATAKAEQRNEPLLRQCESLAAQIAELDQRLRAEKAKVAELEDKVDPHYAPGSTPSRLDEASEWVRLYEEKSALVRQIDDLSAKVAELSRQASRDAKTIRAQDERMRGLEDDVVAAAQELNNRSSRSNRLSSQRVRPSRAKARPNPFGNWAFTPDVSLIDAALLEQRNADAKAWAELEDRWEVEFGIRTHVGDDGKIWLEAGGAKRRKSVEALKRGRQEAFREKMERAEREKDREREEVERVRRGVKMGARKWGWR